MLSTLHNTSAIKLPEITRRLVLELGEDETGAAQTLTLNWRLNALTKGNYEAFMLLQDESRARALRALNAAAKADGAAIDAAQSGKATKKGSKPDASVTRYAKLDAALLGLSDDLEKARGIILAADRDDSFLAAFGQEFEIIKAFRAQLEKMEVKEDSKLESEIEKQRAENVEAYGIKVDELSQMLAHLVASFRFNDGDLIPCTPEVLKELFDDEFLEKAIRAVVEATKAPLGIRGATAA